jgi:hypothetical protein
MEDITTDNKIYKQGVICKDEEERRERYLASHRRFNVKRYHCTECNEELSMGNKINHKRTKKHINNKNNYIS